MKALLALFLVTSMAAGLAAESDTFQPIANSYGVALKVPDNWVLDSQSRRDAKKSLSEMLDGMKRDGKISLLNTGTDAISPSGYARVRLSIATTLALSQEEVGSLSAEGLREIKSSFVQELVNVPLFKVEPESITLKKIQTDDGYWAVRLSYTRSGFGDSGPARVEQNYVPFTNRTVLLTLSHQISKKEILEPLLLRVWASFRLDDAELWPKESGK